MLDLPPVVRAQFEALLLEPIFAPLENALGDFGTVIVQQAAKAIADGLQR